MKREDFQRVFQSPAIFPVVHVLSSEQAIRNVKLALNEGASGVFLINHDFSVEKFLPILRQVRTTFPSAWIGVNFLAIPMRAAAVTLGELQDVRVDGYWADDALIDEHEETQPVAEWTREAITKSGWRGLYFGGVCFKKQRPVRPEHFKRSARIASRYMDIVTTSGLKTGDAVDLHKIAAMREGCGDACLAVASGITPENVQQYGDVDCFLVATGISRPGDFHNLDAKLLQDLMQACRAGFLPVPRALGLERFIPFMGENTRGEKFAWLDPSRAYLSAEAFAFIIEKFRESFAQESIDLVLGIDAAGYPLAGALAVVLRKGFLSVRKGGKLCVDVDSLPYTPPVYRSEPELLELRTPAFHPGTRVLVVDQWIETGRTALVTTQLIERQGGVVAGICSINIEENETEILQELRKYKLVSAMQFGKEVIPTFLPLKNTPNIVTKC